MIKDLSAAVCVFIILQKITVDW